MAPARAGQDPTGTILEATGPGLARTAPERCQRSLKMFLKPIDFYVGAMLVLAVFLRVTETAARCALCLWTMALLFKIHCGRFRDITRKCGEGTCD